jgi:hypothetical protein
MLELRRLTIWTFSTIMVLRKMQIVMCPPHAQPPGFFLESNPLYIQLKWTPTLQNREENKAVGLGLHSSHYLLRLYIHGLRWIDLHMLWSGSGTIQSRALRTGPSDHMCVRTLSRRWIAGSGAPVTAVPTPHEAPRYCADMAKWIAEILHRYGMLGWS